MGCMRKDLKMKPTRKTKSRSVMWTILFAAVAFTCFACQQTSRDMDKGKDSLPSAESSALWTYITKTDPYKNWGPYPAKGKEGLYMGVVKGLTPASNPH